MGLLDLEKHFAFYGSYHSNPTNIIIHILFVWPILFTSLIFLYFTPPLFSPSQTVLNFTHPVLIFNLGFVFAVFYGLFYAALDIKAGSFTAVLTFLCWVGASFVANSIGYELAWKVLHSIFMCLFCFVSFVCVYFVEKWVVSDSNFGTCIIMFCSYQLSCAYKILL